MGAPQGNTNGLTHGVRSYLAIGRLPKGASYIRRLVGGMQRQLEASVRDKYGELTVLHAAYIQSAVRHEVRAQLLTRWQREGEGLSLAERITLAKEIGAASDSRDKCLDKLGLENKRSTIYQIPDAPSN